MTRVGAALIVFVFMVSLSASAQTRRKTRVVENPQSGKIAEAEAARDKQDFATAEALLKEVLKAEPQNYYVWFDLGTVYNASGRKQEAADAFRKSIAANPGVIESNLNLAVLLANSGDSEAGKYLRNAAKLKPNAEQLKLIKTAWMLLGRGLRATDQAGAIDAYEQASALDPKDPAPHVELGAFYTETHSEANAERELKAALVIDPEQSDALALLSNVYLRSKRFADAENMLRQFLLSQPQSATGHLQLGRVLAANGKHEEAIAEYSKALQISPADTDSLRELADSQYELKKYTDALSTLKNAAARLPRDPQVHYSLGRVALRTGDSKLALEESLVAAKLKPGWADAYGQAALAASEQKDYPLALQALDERAKYAPETPGTFFLRATCFDHLRVYEKASENYKKFLVEANGRFPDEEWKARHRLIAIDPESRKKAK